MNYNYLIIEDNVGCLKNLQQALKSFSDFSEIGTANTLKKGLSMALELKPHLIFLDVQLGQENGFDLIKELRQYTTEQPFIIMTTDFDKYAKHAVNADVLYFLDKPIDGDELSMALQKFERRFLELQKHIIVKGSEGVFFYSIDDIFYIQSDNNGIKLILKDGSQGAYITKTMKEVEKTIPLSFMRIHRRYIVNTQYISMVNTSKKTIRLHAKQGDGYYHVELAISDSYLDKIRHSLLNTKLS